MSMIGRIQVYKALSTYIFEVTTMVHINFTTNDRFVHLRFGKYTCYKTIPYYFDFQFEWDNGGSFQCNIVSRTSFVFPRTIIIFSAILAFLMHQGIQEKKIYILKRLSRSINFPNAFKAHYNFLS